VSEHRSRSSRLFRSLVTGRRRWVTGGIGALALSGLVLSGLASPASALDLPGNVTLEQWADVAAHWTTGSLGINGGGASTYEEGGTVPFHLDVTAAGVGTFNFSVCRDYNDGEAFGYLRLAPYNTTVDVAGLLTGSITDAADGPEQPFTGAALVGSVHIDSVNEVGGQGDCGALQRETEVQITIAGGPGGVVSGANVLWGGRLASPADPGVGGNHGAGQYNGASLSMRLGGSAKNVGIKTDAIIQLSTITVQKVVDSGSATADQFCFNISPNPVGVTLPACPAAGQDTVAFVGLPTGNYTVSEAGLTGYNFASGTGSTANCGFVGSVATGSVTNANDPINATCVFHNRRVYSTLTINQVIDPGDDPGLFNLQIDGLTAGTGANVGNGGTTGAVTVSSGAHSVGQTAGTGTAVVDYTSSTSCTANGAPVVLSGDDVSVAAGVDIVCTITLTRAPIIIVDPAPTPDPVVTPDPDPVITPDPVVTPDPDPVVTPDPDPVITPDPVVTPDPDPVITPDPVVTPDPDPVVTPDPDPVVTPDPNPTVDPTVDPGTEPGRCASSRTHPHCGSDDPGVTPEVEGSTETTTTTAAPAVDPINTVAGGGDPGSPAPEVVLPAVEERPAPAPAATLPRTGASSHLGGEVTLAFGLLGAGIALLMFRRRRPATEGQEG